VLPDKPDERLPIETLCWRLGEVIDASSATPGLKTIAMISTVIVRGDPF
jgi:hypothetical protein